MSPIAGWEALLLSAAAAFANEDLGAIGSGVAAARGAWPFWGALAGCFLGSYLADLMWYVIGRLGGRWAMSRAPLKWVLKRDHITRAEQWLARRGLWTIVLCRFIPGASTPLQFAAGALGTPWKTIAGYFALATCAHVPGFFGAGYLASELALELLPAYHRWGLLAGVALVAVVWLALRTAERWFAERDLPASDS